MTEYDDGLEYERITDNTAIYQILVEECGAPSGPRHFYAFDAVFPDCGEYRFIGNQGFGGKVWAGGYCGPSYVTCYPEDDNPERKAARDRANARIKEASGYYLAT